MKPLCKKRVSETASLDLRVKEVNWGRAMVKVEIEFMGQQGRRHSPPIPRIQRAILIDREVDMITPCMTQITFEGLIDETTGIKGGTVTWTPKDRRTEQAIGGSSDAGGVGSHLGAGGSSSGASFTALLNSTDPYFKELRDLPYHVAISRLNKAAVDAQTEYQRLRDKDISQLKAYVQERLLRYPLLDRLTDIATPVGEQVRQQLFHDRLKHELDCVEGIEQEAALNFTQELIYRGAPLLDVLRLLVLISVTWQGVPKRALEPLREELLITYGHEHALTLSALERSGLLQVATSGRPAFHTVRRALRLVVPEAENVSPDAPPTDLSHLYRGYAPLSMRLIETAFSPAGWGKPGSVLSEALALLPGTCFDTTQQTNQGPPSGPVSDLGPQPVDGELSVTLVVFLGGVTFSEISALRWLGPRLKTKFLVLTTQVLNGKTLLSGFVDPLISPGAAKLLTGTPPRHSASIKPVA